MLSGRSMTLPDHPPEPPTLTDRVKRLWAERSLAVKAMSFAMVGVVNTIVDASVFLLSYSFVTSALLPENAALVVANVLAWCVGVTGSFTLNSKITFRAESGGHLRPRAYLAFAASNLVGLVVNTTVLLVAAQYFDLPVWAAKGCAIVASFFVNFSLSNFLVFRRKAEPAEPR